MEKDRYTITFAIKHETAVYLLFLAGGVLAVCVAFILQPRSPELWPNIDAAGITAAIYLIVLLLYTLRRPLSRLLRILIAAVALVGFVAIESAWTGMESQTRWQHRLLLEIRAIIGRGVSYSAQPDSLLTALERYHASRSRARRQLSDAFHSVYPEATVGDDLKRPMYEGDTTQAVILTSLAPDSVTLVCVDKIAWGRDVHFPNITGLRGKVQERYTLTEKGLEHVTDN